MRRAVLFDDRESLITCPGFCLVARVPELNIAYAIRARTFFADFYPVDAGARVG
jgi:hypothetical protein